MKVKVKTEFKDKYTEQIHRVGEELELTVDRINEVLKVGNFIELVAEPVEQKQEETEQPEQTVTECDQKETESVDAGEQVEAAPKQSTRRKRSSK